MDGWLDELEHAGMIRRYVVDGSTFLEIVNWLDHQKIDKPSKSRLPAFVDGSRAFAKPREASTTDLGPRTRTKDLGSGGVVVEREPEAEPKPPAKSLISEEAFGITTEILASMGKRSDDPLAVGSPYIVQKWLTGGMSRDAIMCGVTTAMARKKDDPPSTFKYFENAILRASAELNRPLPIVEIKPADKITVSKHAKTGTFDAAYHSVLDKLNEGFGGPAPQERLRVGEGETDARLLAHRRRQ